MIASLTVALWLGAVSARAQPAAATFGDRAPLIEVTVQGKDNAPAADATVKLTASVGAFLPVKALGGGRFQAQYVLPARRHPQLAIIRVEVERAGTREHIWLTLPLQAKANLKIETEPRSRVTVDVGSRTFGPVQADRAGRALVPAVVPPCIATARIHATDPAGNASEKPLDLRPEPFPRAMLFTTADRASWADSEPTPVEVFAVDAACAPVQAVPGAEGVSVLASAGTLGAASLQGPGRLVFPFRAPDDVGAGLTTFTVKAGGITSAGVKLRVEPGPQVGFLIKFQPEKFTAGSGRTVQLVTSPADARGNVVPGGKQPDRVVTDFGTLQGAAPSLVLTVPDQFEGREVSLVRAEGAVGTSQARLSLETGPPASVVWRSKPRFLHAGETLTAELRVTDAFGNGVSHAPVRVALAGKPVEGIEPLGDGRYRVTTQVPVDAAIGGGELTAEAGPETAAVRAAGDEVQLGQFQRPWAFLLGVSLTAQSNFVNASALVPRLNLGVRVARTNFDLLLEAEGNVYRRFTTLQTTNGGGLLTTSLAGGAVALGARYSLPVAARWSVFASAMVGAQIVSSTLTLRSLPDARTQQEVKPTLLLRGAVGTSVAVGRGRFFLQVEGSRAAARGQLSGNLGGLGVGLGYLHAF